MRLPLSYSVGHLLNRKLSVGLTMLCIAAIIGVFAGLLAFAEGVRRALVINASPEMLVVVKKGATAETNSYVDQDQINKLTALPHLMRHGNDVLISTEVMLQTSLVRRNSKDEVTANVAVRGVEPIAFQVHPHFRIVEGRRFELGGYEVIVGRAAYERFEGLDLGRQIPLGFTDQLFTVVGVFEAAGGPLESEIWGYRSYIGDVHKRRSATSAWIRLDDPRHKQEVIELIQGPSIDLEAKDERSYFADLDINANWILAVTLSLIVFMGTGAAFGVANIMYAMVAHRLSELAMLRAIGFPPRSILLAVLTEAFFLSLVAGGIGCLAVLVLNGRSQDMMSAGFTTVAFKFSVTPRIVGISLAGAVLIGVLGAFHPAWRASRLAIVTALRGE